MATTHRAGEKIDRQQILRGVYEDNLRTVTNQPAPKRDRRGGTPVPKRQPRVGAFFVMGLLVMAGFAYGVLQASQQSSARNAMPPATASQIVQQNAAVPEVQTVVRARDKGKDSPINIASLYGLKVRTIVIDPGHGGIDGGTVGQLGTKEKDVTLDVARRLKARLERNYGYRILLTRDEDTRVSLRDRAEFANSHGADLFVSIHVNWLPEEPVSAVETYYFSPDAGERELQIAHRENEDSEYSVAEFNQMLSSVSHTMKIQESKRLAESVQKSLYGNVSRIDRSVENWGVKRAPFVVLLGSRAPSILAEIACLSNREDEIKLNTDEYRENLAIFLEEGIINYLQQPPL